MVKSTKERYRAKISVTIDPTLLGAVDEYVDSHSGYDRSRVVDEALYFWYAKLQGEAMEEQFGAPRTEFEQAEYEAWRRIRRAAAERWVDRKEGQA